MNRHAFPSRAAARVVALGNILTLVNGRAYSQDELLDSGTPVIRIQNLNGGDRWYYSDLNLGSEKYCERGDLLFAWSGTFGPYVWDGPRSIFHYHIWKVLPSPQLDPRYAYHLLRNITEAVKAAGRGISMVHMTKGGMEAWSVSLPTLEDQRRIAAILDKADALRQKRKRAIALLDSLTQSIFLEMFGNPRVNPKGWKVVPCAAAAKSEDYRRRPLKSSDRDERHGPYPYYGASGIIDYINEAIFSGRFLLIGEDGANLLSRSSDIAFIAEGDFWVNNHAHVLSDNGSANLTYLCSLFLQTDLTPYVTGSAQPKLNQAKLDSIPIMLPPRDLQDEFDRRVSQVTKIGGSLSQSLIESEHLFASLQHRAFSGQL